MSWDEQERRVAEILGVKEGDNIPHVSRQTLRTYHAYLRANVKFPFKAKIEDLDGDATIERLFALRDCPDLTFYGLFVRGYHKRSLIEIPIQDRVLNNVWCPHEGDITTMADDFWGRMSGNSLVLHGTCVRCQGRVARVLEERYKL